MKTLSILALLVLVVPGLVCIARKIVVISVADSGTGTLRWALQAARPGDVIEFDPAVFSPDSPAYILLESELPPISRPLSHVTIDASNAGVIIDGRNVPGDWNNGIQVYTDDCAVMGLEIRNFTGSGITACSASRTRIGGASDSGEGPTGQGNLVASNGIGISLCGGGTDNVIAGNIIGTDLTLRVDLGNWPFGISIEEGVTNTTIGPANVLAYNHVAIDIRGEGTLGNTLTRNVFHESQLTTVVLRDGGNLDLPAPFIELVDAPGGQVRGTACSECQVEVFTVSDDGWTSFEGVTTADTAGCFVFSKGEALDGQAAVAAAIDANGNSSALSARFSAASWIQERTEAVPERFVTYPSVELDDNRIGVFTCSVLHPEYEPEIFPDYGVLDASHILDLGVTRVRLSISNLDPDKIDWEVSEFEIDPEHDAFIHELIGNGVSVTFNLNFWDKDYVAAGGTVSYPRFRTESEVQRYLDYVRVIARHFRGHITSYELWNEPTNRDSIMWIEVEDYLELARRAIPVIREEDPDAKIIMGAVAFLAHEDVQDYLFEIISSSDLMPLAEGLSWHPMYGTSPEFAYHRDYYYGYPNLVREFRRAAADNGFEGTFQGDELIWMTRDQQNPTQPWPNKYTERVCAKYYARGVVMHLGLVDSASVLLLNNKPLVYGTIQNLCTAMAGNQSVDMPAKINIEYDGPVAYCAFRYPNGDRVLAIWTDGVAQDDDPCVSATIVFPGFAAGAAVGIDVLHGFEQKLTFEAADGSTVIRDLLVKDYPILIRLSDITFGSDYEETVGDGFHRFGDIEADGGGVDRDGDGVQDEQDLCPDWPGSTETSGC